ncbi:MAG: hypothetical protein WBM87_09895 [Woeseiaceae bacterium]
MAKKTMTKKTMTKKTARPKKAKSVFDRLESSVVGTPIKVANRTFLAGLGVVATVQNELTKFQSDFEKTFEKLVKDGEKARAQYRREFKGFKKDVKKLGADVRNYGEELVVDVVEEVVETKDKVVENLRSAA